MKRKISLILVAFCCLGVFSSAGKNDKKCCNYSACPMQKKNAIQNSTNRTGQAGFDMSPLQLFGFGS